MRKKTKTEMVAQVFSILNAAHYGKMADDEKIKLWKIARTLKPVAIKMQEDAQDAAEKLIPYPEYQEKLRLAKQYENAQSKGEEFDGMTPAEYRSFLDDFKKYNELVTKAVKEYADAEVEIEFDGISEEAFTKLIASNQWTMGQTIDVGGYIVE